MKSKKRTEPCQAQAGNVRPRPPLWPTAHCNPALLGWYKISFRGGNEHNAMGENGEGCWNSWRILDVQNIVSNFEFCLWDRFKCSKNCAVIDVSCWGLTGQTKQILHGKRIWNFSLELWTTFFTRDLFSLHIQSLKKSLYNTNRLYYSDIGYSDKSVIVTILRGSQSSVTNI